MIGEQLALNVSLRDSATFDSYQDTHGRGVVDCLQRMASGSGELQSYLWGAPDTGKSHLLQAVCHQAYSRDLKALYLPLNELGASGAELLSGLEKMDVVCIDDLDFIAAEAPWQEALFHLINKMRQAEHRLLLASRENPAHLETGLPDLASRLVWGPVFQQQTLDDDGKLVVLTARAAARGFELSPETGRYLLRNCPRDLSYLLDLIDRLDAASLAAQRRITIPFVKEVLRLETTR